MIMWLKWILSPSRMAAKKLRHAKVLDTFCDIMRWNVPFYIFELIIGLGVFAVPFGGTMRFGLVIFMYILATRLMELFTAFYTEALTKKFDAKHLGADIIPSERLLLVSFAYLEAIILYGIIFRIIDVIALGDAMTEAKTWFDYLFFSAATLTTTGSGSVAPHNSAAKLFAVFEALNGIAFVAIALSTYIGDDGTRHMRKDMNTQGCFEKIALRTFWTNVRKSLFS